MSHGSINESIVDVRGCMQRVLLCGAASFILFHNHPSGNTRVSDYDKKATSQLKDAAKLLGISFLDHLIIGDGYVSLRESGFL